MHYRYFPSCRVHGPIEPPVLFGNMMSTGAIPKKCGECEHLFNKVMQPVGRFGRR